MSARDAIRNLGSKAARRLQSAHKPLVRYARRSEREREHQAFRDEAEAIDRRIAEVAAASGPIVVGPWLAEVGYEVLYWIPFLRWFQDAHGVPRERLIVVSRGGLDALYRPMAGGYVDLFDLATPQELAARNAERRATHEGGGQKQSEASAFDRELAERARAQVGAAAGPLCIRRSSSASSATSGTATCRWMSCGATSGTRWRRAFRSRPCRACPASSSRPGCMPGRRSPRRRGPLGAVRTLVAQAARVAPVVLLDYDAALDEHRGLDLTGLDGVISVGRG